MGKLHGERLCCLASLLQENIQRPEFLMFMVVLSIVERSTFIMFRDPSLLYFHRIPTIGPSPTAKKHVAAALLQSSNLGLWMIDDEE